MAGDKLEFQDGSSWSTQAEEYAKIIAKGNTEFASSPMTEPLKAYIKTINDVKPLSTATAIMDAGCGTGQGLTELIAKYGSEIPASTRILASDFSEGMVNILRQQATEKAAAGEKIWSQIETSVLDLQDLSSISDATMSHVFSSFVFGIVPDTNKALAEINRVLASGGVLVEVSWSKFPWMTWVGDAIEKKFPGKTTALPWQEDFKSESGVQGLFKRAGFENVKTQVVEGVMGDDDIKHYVLTFSRSKNPGMRLAFAKLDDGELVEAEKYLEEELHKLFPDGKVRFRGEAIVVSGSKK